MAKQTINVGTTANDRNGDPLRIAFQKTNSNFSELYDAIDNMENVEVDRTWVGSLFTYNVIDWNSGSQVQIESTPFETSNATTYDARTDSEYIYFVWDQDFIDNVWEGWNTPAGEGESYSVSLDDGLTWIPVERSGYNGGTFFYFWIPNELQDQYLFTYLQGQTVLIRYNRGSLAEIWFDLSNAPVDANTIIGVDMSVVANATIGELSAKVIRPNYRFANVLYNDNTGEGGVNSGANIWSGSGLVEDAIRMSIRRNGEQLDAGRVYASFNDGQTGSIDFYWNAKLYTITDTVMG